MADRDLAARLRAAFAYAGLTKAERAEALGVSERTVTRYESGENAVNPRRLPAIANATGVPESFFEHGFPNGEPSTPERVEALEHQYATLRLEIAESRAAAVEALAELSQTVAQHGATLAELQAARRRRPPEEDTGQ